MEWAVSGILGAYIIFSELTRVPRLFYLDFLRGTSVVFFLVYVIVPMSIYLLDIDTHERFYWVEWVDYRDVAVATLAQALALSSYILIRFGFYVGYRVYLVKNLANAMASSIMAVPRRAWFWLAAGLGALSLGFLLMYSWRRGAGLGYLLITAGQVRVGQYVPGVEEASFTFLTFSMIGIFSSLVYLGLLHRIDGQRSGSWGLHFLRLAFGATLLLSLAVLWMRAGRLHLINYLLVLGLQGMRGKSLLPKILGVAGAFLGLLLFYFGKYVLGVAQSFDSPQGLGDLVSLLSLEFSFPYLSLVNALSGQVLYRYFIDIPIAVIYVIGVPFYVLITGSPPTDLPSSVAKANTIDILGTADLGEIPVDLVSFGYRSAGVFGVILVSFLFGGMLAFLERTFPKTAVGVPGVLRTAWIIFCATVCLLYADPVNVLRDGLYMLGPTLLAFGVALVLRSRRASVARKRGE